MAEAEQVFFNSSLLMLEDTAHSRQECCLHALAGMPMPGTLHITFTLRRSSQSSQSSQSIRVIPATDMHRKERAIDKQAD